jgi:DedD protein
MAKAISDDELQLKKRARRRLVGAIALVLLVVVFLPMFLDNEPRPLNQDIAISIPPIPGPDASTLPAPPEVAEAPVTPPSPVAATPPAPVERVPAPPPPEAARVVSSTAPKPAAPAPKPPAAAPKPATVEGFVVQLGAFSNSANAVALQKKLLENKFKAYTEIVTSPAGERTRVRVGPYPSREEAERARDSLRARKLVIGEATVVRLGD